MSQLVSFEDAQPGMKYMFNEDGMYLIVELLAKDEQPNGKDGDVMQGYTLRTVKVLENGVLENSKVGEEFHVAKSVKYGQMVCWYLRTLEAAAERYGAMELN